jgi:succinate dehydrogenase, hydrophobic membrane anchor protein
VSGPVQFRNHVKVSERHGASEWLSEKVALALLMPLGLWLVSTIFTLTGAGYEAVMAWFGRPLNAWLSAMTLLTFLWFASLAWKVILEDYVEGRTRGWLIGLINLICLLVAAAGVFFIVRMALGSAPLPAGLGA